MARAAVQRRLTWQLATVDALTDETNRVRTLTLNLPSWPGHLAGQHLDVRLTAEDGYQAEREYSVAAAPGEPVAITVERLKDGEVSPYLTQDLQTGDEIEIRGPVGGYFVWRPEDGGPLLLIAGGSGVVPLRAMLRHRLRSGSMVPARLIYSARTVADIIYSAELMQEGDVVDVVVTLTREQPPGWTGRTGRVDNALLRDLAWPAGQHPLAYVCGPTAFAEAVSGTLLDLGYPPQRIKIERFGGTGGP
ncbi:MAG: ferredoxin reductase [Nocardiopsaceae bacterium]|jgi:ferredoxin-NADP reductase|nr:ferredoxin reductase [Nocardiopsaceae bacterium]